MPKVIRFIQSIGENFAGLRNILVQYGRVTALSGRNGQGKTSIGTLPVWVFFGKDLVGADYMKDKYSPRPSNYKYDRVFASIIFSVDGVEYKFGREIDGKKNNFYINDIPQTATDFNNAVAALFSQDEFIALYFPAYFFGLHWTKQRELLMQNIPSPLNKTVFAGMQKPQADKLAELLKKHTVDDLFAKYKADKPKLDKSYIAAESRTRTMQEQLERLSKATADLTELEAEAAVLKEEIAKEDKIVVDAISINSHYNALKDRLQQLEQQVKASVAAWPALKEETIEDTCKTCKQALQDEAVDAVKADKVRRMEAYKAKHDDLKAKRNEARAALAEAKWIDTEEQRAKVRAIEDKYDVVLVKIREHKEHSRLAAEVKAAEEAEATTLASLREATFILDAIKAFKAKEAELQATQISELFTKLSIRLFKYVKSSDEYEPDFSVQMDGKDYEFLSAGEKIGAGLELTEVLFKQSGLITPVFIDGIGEYTGTIAAYDQIITGRAVPDQELKIEIDGGK
ncbi:ATPase [Paenibacillus harenae]|uniref:Nuclease SbcCD subunit C n=1 Tax=Paenibacillus harenae TaxID=306543 RepID=A0ABT9U3W0_PAEHA|nr:ATPase [Paenibacillus harenae]MDQ0114320.1 gas vesicle protein [Paenibacillus harenae]